MPLVLTTETNPGDASFSDLNGFIGSGADGQIVVYDDTGSGLEPASTGQVGRVSGDLAQVQIGNVGSELSVGRVSFVGIQLNGIENQGASGLTICQPAKAFPQIVMGDTATTGAAFIDALNTGSGSLNIQTLIAGGLRLAAAGGSLGFYGAAAMAKPTVTGSRGGNAALASLLTALASLGLITDSTTP